MEIEFKTEDLPPAVPITARTEYGALIVGPVSIKDKDDVGDAPTK